VFDFITKFCATPEVFLKEKIIMCILNNGMLKTETMNDAQRSVNITIFRKEYLLSRIVLPT